MDADAAVRPEAQRARPGDPKGPEPEAEAKAKKEGTRPPLGHPAPPERLASEPGEYAAVDLRGMASGKDVESGSAHSLASSATPLFAPPQKHLPTKKILLLEPPKNLTPSIQNPGLGPFIEFPEPSAPAPEPEALAQFTVVECSSRDNVLDDDETLAREGTGGNARKFGNSTFSRFLKRCESPDPPGLPSNRSVVEVPAVDPGRNTHRCRVIADDPPGLPSSRSAVEVTAAGHVRDSGLNMSTPVAGLPVSLMSSVSVEHHGNMEAPVTGLPPLASTVEAKVARLTVACNIRAVGITVIS